MTQIHLSRRDLLQRSAFGTIAWAVGLSSGTAWLRAAEVPAALDLITRSEKPYNAEPPLNKLVEKWLTPVSAFYVRNHGNTPKLDAKNVTLTVDGLIEKPLTFKVAELVKKLPAAQATATLTCAGNRRNEYSAIKKVGGVQWDAGAIGNAEWRGVHLSDLLKLAGVKPGAKHVWFEGLDQITEKGETFPFGGSISLDKAMSNTPNVPGALLATHMNGQELTAEHGFPLRSVVPGYIGARSVKWLSKITVSDRPSPNHYLAHAYKLITEDTPEAIDAASPIYEYMLNSAICLPSPEAAISGDRLTAKGFALAGGAAGRSLKLVEVSTDGGQSWTQAKFTSPLRDCCWALWSADVPVSAQTDSLLVRATDTSGDTQPQTMPWNVKGYQYNAWHKVSLKRA